MVIPAHAQRMIGAARAGSRVAGRGAAVTVAVGGLLDAPKLRRRELNLWSFVGRRSAEAGVAVVGSAAASLTSVGITSAAGAVAAAGGIGSVTACAVLASPLVIPVAAGVAASVAVGGTQRYIKRFRTT